MCKAIIFDLDDTLISEKEYIKSGYKAVSKYIEEKYRLDKEKTYVQLNILFSESTSEVFNRFFEINNIKYEKEDIINLVNCYRNHIPTIKFYDDVIPTITELKKRRIKVGIITDGYKETQRRKLQVLEAEKIFDEIIVTDELGKKYWKPNPKAFELMKEKLNVEYNEMLYVGDNPEKDFYISKIYPITCVRIMRNEAVYDDREYKEDIKEKIRIDNLNKLLDKNIIT